MAGESQMIYVVNPIKVVIYVVASLLLASVAQECNWGGRFVSSKHVPEKVQGPLPQDPPISL